MGRATYYEGDRYYLKIHGCRYNGKWVDRLAAYENTGLEPEEVEDLLKCRIEEIAKQRTDGIPMPEIKWNRRTGND
ncbi:MAG: hypothetical protein LIO57_04170 [Oscillospiraceae bacterium]|nr:hypothetical protein [Oscillospiraceae bacterium]